LDICAAVGKMLDKYPSSCDAFLKTGFANELALVLLGAY